MLLVVVKVRKRVYVRNYGFAGRATRKVPEVRLSLEELSVWSETDLEYFLRASLRCSSVVNRPVRPSRIGVSGCVLFSLF